MLGKLWKNAHFVLLEALKFHQYYACQEKLQVLLELYYKLHAYLLMLLTHMMICVHGATLWMVLIGKYLVPLILMRLWNYNKIFILQLGVTQDIILQFFLVRWER